jgi:hypothetical protein
MTPIIREKPTDDGVYITVRKRGQRTESKSITVYGATIEEMLDLIRQAIAGQPARSKRKAS